MHTRNSSRSTGAPVVAQPLLQLGGTSGTSSIGSASGAATVVPPPAIPPAVVSRAPMGINGGRGNGGRGAGVGRGVGQLRAYDISANQEAQEVLQNSGRPMSEFTLVNGEPLANQEFKLREVQRRYSAMTDNEVYQAQILNEYEEMRKKMRMDEPGGLAGQGGVAVAPARKVTSHFSDRDGKLITSYNREITRSTVEFAMPFLRMADPFRIADICIDELHICLDVNLAREIYLSKANIHHSLLPESWKSIVLWSSVENLSVMKKDKFSHLLLFDGNFEELDRFSLANFLLKPNSLDCLTFLREALDNMELVYRCVMGEVYMGISVTPKDFLMNNMRMLATRDFNFVRGVFEAAFIRFQMELRSRDVSTGALPLNRPELVVDFFKLCFTFNLDVFSRDEEDIFKVRQVARQVASKSLMVGKTSGTAVVSMPLGVGQNPRFTANLKRPCIVYLANKLGVAKLGGRAITSCHAGASCKFDHVSFPLSKAHRGTLIAFIKKSTSSFFKTQGDRDSLLSSI